MKEPVGTVKRGRVKRAFWFLFVNKREEIPFIVFLSFLTTFVATRVYLYLTNNDIVNMFGFWRSLTIRGVHIHHFIFGIVILSVISFVALYDVRPVVHRRLAILYGLALGWIFDEFALWFGLKDNYSARLSYDAVITVSLIFLNMIYFRGFWKRMGRRVSRVPFVVVRGIGAVVRRLG